MRIFKLFFICFVFVFGIFLLTYIFPSMINNNINKLCFSLNCFSERYASDIYNLHITHPAFAGRALTSSAQEAIHRLTGFGYAKSFAILNFSLLFFCGLIVCILAKQRGLTNKESFFSIFLFYFSFTILLAFFHSVDTYDEPIQYLALLSSLFFLYKKQLFLFGLCIFFALLAREGSVLTFPAFAVLLFYDKIGNLKDLISKKLFIVENFKNLSSLLIPAVIFLAVFYLILSHRQVLGRGVEYAASHRFTYWQYNFKNWQFGVESIISTLMVLAWPSYVLYYYRKVKKFAVEDKKFIYAFIITAIINTPITIISTRAREARILALPLVFIWPVLGKYCLEIVNWINWRLIISAFKNKIIYSIFRMIILFLSLGLIYLISFYLFKPTDARGSDILFQLYFFIAFTLMAIYRFLFDFNRVK